MMDPAALHARLLTLDSHIDIPWPNGPDPFTETPHCVDMVKMRAGHVRAGCFAAYVPQGPLTDEGHEAARERAFAMLDRIREMARCANGIDAVLAVSAEEIEAAHHNGAIAIVPAVENGYAIGRDLSLLARFRELGVRYLTLCHNGHNLLTDSSNPRADLRDPPERHGGLSDLGREAIRAMNRLGLLIDVSHVSRNGMLQAAAHSRTPVVATHSCVRSLCDHPRNLDDVQLDALRDTEGLVQITAVPCFLRPGGRANTVSVSDYCDHLDYVVERCGVAHVGISSDFDGGGGFAGWKNAAESANLTAELVKRGYGESEIQAFWGGNFLRLLRCAERVAEELTAQA
jgi:membrane dipeptidase